MHVYIYNCSKYPSILAALVKIPATNSKSLVIVYIL